MKIRSGFVSNSSTSSFIIGCKGKPSKIRVIEILTGNSVIDKKSWIYDVVERAADILCNSEKITLDEFVKDQDDPYSKDEYTQSSEYYTRIRRIYDSGMNLYLGSVANDSEDSIEQCLVDLDFNIDEKDFIFWKEGGF